MQKDRMQSFTGWEFQILNRLFATLLILLLSLQPTWAARGKGVCFKWLVDNNLEQRWATNAEIEENHLKYCSTDCRRGKEIYDNCIVSLMPDGKVEPTKRNAIWGKCQRAACNPTFFDNLRYWPTLCLVGSHLTYDDTSTAILLLSKLTGGRRRSSFLLWLSPSCLFFGLFGIDGRVRN